MHARNVYKDDPLCPWVSRWELQFPKVRGCGNSTHTFQDCFPSAFPQQGFQAESTLESLAFSGHQAWVGTIEPYVHLPNVGLSLTHWASFVGVVPPSCPQHWPQCELAFGLSLFWSGAVCPLSTPQPCAQGSLLPVFPWHPDSLHVHAQTFVTPCSVYGHSQKCG